MEYAQNGTAFFETVDDLSFKGIVCGLFAEEHVGM